MNSNLYSNRNGNEDARVSWPTLLLICALLGLPFGIGFTVVKMTAAPAVSVQIQVPPAPNPGNPGAPLPLKMLQPRWNASAASLEDGRILIYGGFKSSPPFSGDAEQADLVEVFDPTTMLFTQATAEEAALVNPDPNQSQALNVSSIDLTSGFLFEFGWGINGGRVLMNGVNLNSAWDPNIDALKRDSALAIQLTGSITVTNTQYQPITYPLTNRFLVIGGLDANGTILDSAMVSPARLETDLSDYSPGQDVILSGSGWKPGEMIDIYVIDNFVTNPEWIYDTSVQADPNGDFETVPYLFEVLIQHLGVTFDLSAVGSTSGLMGQVKFTDAATLLFLRAGTTTCLFSGSASQTLQATAGTSQTVLASTAQSATFDFYSPPLTAPVSLASSEKAGGVIGLKNNGAAGLKFTPSGVFYDYNPADGTSALIVSCSGNQSSTVNSGVTKQTSINNTAIGGVGHTLLSGHLLRVSVTLSTDQASGNNWELIYNAAAADGNSNVQLPQNSVISWPFGSFTTCNQAPAGISLTSTSVAENQISGTAVGNFSTTDPDIGNSFAYTLVPGTGSTDNSSFAVSGAQLLTAAVFDLETKSSYSIRVRSTDQGGLFVEKQFTISVNDVNDVTPVVTAGQSFGMAENSANGTVVGSVLATDGDVTPTTFGSWTITGGTGNTAFAINPASGQVTVADSAQLNYETTTSFTLAVTVSDGVHTSAAQTVTVTLSDLNDVTPVVTAGQSFSLAENSANGTVVGSVLATDGDVTPASFGSWTITGGTGDTAFAINPASGQVTVADSAQLNYETTTSFMLAVTVSDGVHTSAAQTVTVSLSDVNDVTPVVTAGQSFGMAENSANGTVVGSVLATDGDVTPASFGSWTITGGTGDTAFAINPASGQVTVADSAQLNYETTTSFTLVVTVSDGVHTSAAQTVTVSLSDVNDVTPVVTAGQSFSIGRELGQRDGGRERAGHGRRCDADELRELDDHGRDGRHGFCDQPGQRTSDGGRQRAAELRDDDELYVGSDGVGRGAHVCSADRDGELERCE